MYVNFLEYWKSHPEIKTVKWIQAKSTDIDSAVEKYTGNISEESDHDVPGKSGKGESESDNLDQEESADDDDDNENEQEDIEESPITFGSNKFAALVEDD